MRKFRIPNMHIISIFTKMAKDASIRIQIIDNTSVVIAFLARK